VVGDVKFGKGGGWSEARVLQVQYQNIKGADLSDFKDSRTQAVVWPSSLASGKLVYPYAKAKRNVGGGVDLPSTHEDRALRLKVRHPVSLNECRRDLA
jgi:hypothetical protein